MTKSTQPNRRVGGFEFKNTGKVDIKAGGDVVAGDKVTHTRVNPIFQNQSEKEQFGSVLDEMKSLLQEQLRPALEKLDLPAETKRKVTEGVSRQVKTLTTAKTTAAALPLKKSRTKKDTKTLTKTLDNATKFVGHLKSFAKTAIGFETVVAPILTKLEPLLHAARSLLGLG